MALMKLSRDRRVLVIVLLALVVAACGGDSGESEGDTTTQAAGDTSTTEVTDTTSEATTTTLGEEPATTSPEEDPTALRLGVMPFANAGGPFIASELGFFEEEGLEVSTTTFQGGSDAVTAVLTGDLDITYTGTIPALSAMSAGADLVFVTGGDNGRSEAPDFHAALVREDSGIESAEDLRGQRIAVPIIGSVVWLTGIEWLQQNGISSDDVEFAEVPFPQMNDVLLQGEVDAALQLEPFVTVGTGAGLSVLAYPYLEVIPGLPGGAFVARSDWAAENEEILERFTRALNEAFELSNTDEQLYRELVAEYTGIDPELVSEMVLGEVSVAVPIDEMQGLADLMASLDVIDETFDISDFVYEHAARS